MIQNTIVLAVLRSPLASLVGHWQRLALLGVFAVFGGAILLFLVTHPALALRRLRIGPLFERTADFVAAATERLGKPGS